MTGVCQIDPQHCHGHGWTPHRVLCCTIVTVHASRLREEGCVHAIPRREIWMETAATARDLQYLRHAIALAAASKARGKHPFAALIVDDRDAVLAEAGNAFGWPDGDATGHAELRACFEIPEMSTFLCFRGPSGSDAISKIP